MMNVKRERLIHLLILLFILISYLLRPGLVSAERPFSVTERAIPVERGSFRLEAGLSLDRISPNAKGTTLSADLRYGLISNLELDAKLPYLFLERGNEHENRAGDILLRTKIRFLKGREANPLSIAGAMLIKLPSAGHHEFFDTTGEADVGLLAIASKEFASVTAHINFGYIFIGNPPFKSRPDQLRYALGLEFKTDAEPTRMIGEVSGSTDVGSNASNGLLSALVGISYEADQDVVIDTSVGAGLTHGAPDYTWNLGFTYAFR